MFSFELHDQKALAVWRTLAATLPENYQVPDPDFLFSLHPGFDPSTLETKQSPLPGAWESEALCQQKLPNGYQIPDLVLLKRFFMIR